MTFRVGLLQVVGLARALYLTHFQSGQQNIQLYKYEIDLMLQFFIKTDWQQSVTDTLQKCRRKFAVLKDSHESDMRINTTRIEDTIKRSDQFCQIHSSIQSMAYSPIKGSIGRFTIYREVQNVLIRRYSLSVRRVIIGKRKPVEHGTNITAVCFEMPYSGPWCNRHFFRIVDKQGSKDTKSSPEDYVAINQPLWFLVLMELLL